MNHSTQIRAARAGGTTAAMRAVASDEGYPAEWVRDGVARGRIVIPANVHRRNVRAIGIGRDLRTKVNANIGNSMLAGTPGDELEKLDCAVRHGTDTVMDLSTGPRADEIRKAILERCPVPVGTVPIYQAAAQVAEPSALTLDLLLQVIVTQAEQGVDYMTLHAGLRREHLGAVRRRLAGIVSRGGALLAAWMAHHGRENPLFEHFDEVLAICREHDVTISLGDGLRPGCLADGSDEAQMAELHTLGDLVRRCREAGVQAMVEGPGHLPLDQIERNMRAEEEECDGAPFYVLGPVVTDCAPGYDHITSAIGGAWAAFYGAAMLCYVTPMEHLGLPRLNDVREGVVAARIAAHAADVARGRPGARRRDDAMSAARARLDWEGQFDLALDPERAREWRTADAPKCGRGETEAEPAACTMCGPQFCPFRISAALKEPDPR